ncbi:MAG: hypothetical protein LH614_03930 [Pyrinomonadaceae bacterium]|nr:hypothetical protein [Pyrinomonadaceae bacterium]
MTAFFFDVYNKFDLGQYLMTEREKIMKTLLLLLVTLSLGFVSFTNFHAEHSTAQALNQNLPARLPANESPIEQDDSPKSFDRLIEKAKNSGTVRVIIGLRVANYKPEGELNARQLKKQRAKIKRAQNALLNRLKSFRLKEVKKFDNIPFISAEVGVDALTRMQKFKEIKSIQEDEAVAPM